MSSKIAMRNKKSMNVIISEAPAESELQMQDFLKDSRLG